MIIPVIFTNLIPSMIITFVSLTYLIQDGLYLLLACSVSVSLILFYFFVFKFLIEKKKKNKKKIYKFISMK